MQQPIVTPPETDEIDDITKRDVLAMIAMIDYLITQVKPVDGVAAHCLDLARKSLESGAARCEVPLH
jgi:hypothetical protein